MFCKLNTFMKGTCCYCVNEILMQKTNNEQNGVGLKLRTGFEKAIRNLV